MAALSSATSLGTGSVPSASAVAADAANHHQMRQFLNRINLLRDPSIKDEAKLKSITDLDEDLEVVVNHPLYGSHFVPTAVPALLSWLRETPPGFVRQVPVQETRKLVYEILHRLPPCDAMRPFVNQLLVLCFSALETENEENVLILLRIVIDTFKAHRPHFFSEIHQFLAHVKSMYQQVAETVDEIFSPQRAEPIRCAELSQLDVAALLPRIYSATDVVCTEKKNHDGTNLVYTLLPPARNSLKVLAELPIIVVLMYQLYKQTVHQEISEYIPCIMDTLVLQPHAYLTNKESLNKEVFLDFIAAQVKTLSFLAYTCS